MSITQIVIDEERTVAFQSSDSKSHQGQVKLELMLGGFSDHDRLSTLGVAKGFRRINAATARVTKSGLLVVWVDVRHVETNARRGFIDNTVDSLLRAIERELNDSEPNSAATTSSKVGRNSTGYKRTGGGRQARSRR